MSNIKTYLSQRKKEKPNSGVSAAKLEAMLEYEQLLNRFGKEICYEDFLKLVDMTPDLIQAKETKFRSSQAKKAYSHLEDNEQTLQAKKYIKRLYKWFDVTLTKEEVDSFSKLNIKNGDMRRRYLKYIKES